jgi:hypothetical protein
MCRLDAYIQTLLVPLRLDSCCELIKTQIVVNAVILCDLSREGGICRVIDYCFWVRGNKVGVIELK